MNRLSTALSLVAELAAEGDRAERAKALANFMGADDLLIFVADPDIGALLPARGMRCTLPGAAAWKSFLAETARVGHHSAPLPFPTDEAQALCLGRSMGDSTVIVFIGGNPDHELLSDVVRLLPLLSVAFSAEQAALNAKATTSLARNAARQLRDQATSLEQARRMANDEVIGRRHIQAELNRSNSNLAFLVSVGNELDRLTSVDVIMKAIGAKLGDYLNLSMCSFAEINEATDIVVVTHDWHRSDVPSVVGTYRLAEFVTDDFQKAGRAGEPFIVRDTKTDSRTYPKQHDAFKVRSFICVPFIQDGQWRFLIGIYHSEIYDWRSDEIDLIREITARIWSRLERIRAENTVRETAARLQFMAESMPQKIFTATPSGDVDYFNHQWMDYTGLSFEEIREWGWTQFIHPGDLDENLRLWKNSLATGVPFLCEHRFRRSDNTYRWHLSRAAAMRNESGAIIKWLGSNTDIEDQKEIQAELRRSNADLMHFASIASHDLQEPVRMISSYITLLERSHGSRDAKSIQFMARISDAAQRLRSIIQALLSYASVGSGLKTQDVQSITVLREALDNLEDKISISGAVILFEELPCVRADRILLLLLFQNLIGNAIKFCKGRAPVIRVTATSDGEETVFTISDNGIGISRENQAKVFGLFQRFHNQSEFSGFGIGLATCQKIIERHGGRIWVESTLGEGSMFSFSLPRT